MAFEMKVPFSYGFKSISYAESSDGAYRTQPLHWAVYRWAGDVRGLVPHYDVGEDDFPSDYAYDDVYKAFIDGRISEEELAKLFKEIVEEDSEFESTFEVAENGLVGVLRRKG